MPSAVPLRNTSVQQKLRLAEKLEATCSVRTDTTAAFLGCGRDRCFRPAAPTSPPCRKHHFYFAAAPPQHKQLFDSHFHAGVKASHSPRGESTDLPAKNAAGNRNRRENCCLPPVSFPIETSAHGSLSVWLQEAPQVAASFRRGSLASVQLTLPFPLAFGSR